MKALLATLAVLMTANISFADQCAYISREQAKKAVQVLLDATDVQSLCEPCGETTPSRLKVKSIGMSDVNYQGYWGVDINGQNSDLAYTYVNGLNLAKIVGCPAQGVSASLK